MKLSDLGSYFEGKISAETLKDEISSEINEYRKLIEAEKDVIPIYCEGNQEVKVSRTSFSKILNDYLNGSFDETSLRYLCEILSFEQNGILIFDQKVREGVQILSEPKINFPITKSLVQKIEEWLRSNGSNFIYP